MSAFALQLGLDAQPWARLDDKQRSAATYLGYTENGWNAELDDPSIAEVAAATDAGAGRAPMVVGGNDEEPELDEAEKMQQEQELMQAQIEQEMIQQQMQAHVQQQQQVQMHAQAQMQMQQQQQVSTQKSSPQLDSPVL